MYKYFGVAAAGLLIMFVLSGCVADSFGLSGKEQIEAIGKYPRTGLNLQPDDGFFMITGKVVVRTILCPLTLAISEGVLLSERSYSFNSYAVDLKKAKYDQEVLPRIKYRFDSFLGEKKDYAVLHMGEPTAAIESGDYQVVIWKIDTTDDATFYSSIAKQRKPLSLFKRRSMTLCQNDSGNNFKYNYYYGKNDEQVRLTFNKSGTCIKWEVLKLDPVIEVTPDGLVEVY